MLHWLNIKMNHFANYTIVPEPLETRRPIRVVCIGAGYSGLLMSIIVSQRLGHHNVDYKVYEKNADIGGTWLVNRYAHGFSCSEVGTLCVSVSPTDLSGGGGLCRFPGCKCDSPAHIYSYSFNPNPEWSNVYVGAAEIHEYLKKTSQKYDCDRFMSYHKRVVSASWDERSSRWRLKVADTATGVEFDDSCHVLINASGPLR